MQVTTEMVHELLHRAGQFKGMTKGAMIRDIESVAGSIVMLENNLILSELVKLQTQSNENQILMISLLEQIKNSVKNTPVKKITTKDETAQ
jgi:hypothetical protein